MKKIETIWHYLLSAALTEKKYKFTQQEIARKFGFSLSTVNHALANLTELGGIRKETKFFVLENFQKVLYFWASARKLPHDIIYSTYFNSGVTEIEGLLPPGSIYACYSAARKILGEPPADYSAVYCYLAKEALPLFTERFPANDKQSPNIFVLKATGEMPAYGSVTTLAQTFVDIWNLKDWYGKDFLEALEKKINAILS